MDELIGSITRDVGLDADTARSAVRIILSFLYQEGDRETMTSLLQHLPGAVEFIDTTNDDSSATLGGLGGLMGGGVMAVAGRLQAIGLGMGDIQGVTQATIDFARQHAGRELVDAAVASIPGLSQFV